ncbi:MAG: hypothetical protein RL318_865 [Fibrobacterota bacterium]|jgi:hypothetical protein
MSITSVGANPWYTQNNYQPAKAGSDDLRKQFMTLEASLQKSDLKAAKAAMEELRKTQPGKDAGSASFQALAKALDKDDLAAAKTAFAEMLAGTKAPTAAQSALAMSPSVEIFAEKPVPTKPASLTTGTLDIYG